MSLPVNVFSRPASSLPLLRFEGDALSKQQKAEIEARVSRLKAELTTLAQENQTAGETPILLKLDVAALTKRAKRFLSRMMAHPERPTPFIIGAAGGSASGKSYINKLLQSLLPPMAETTVDWKAEKNGALIDGFSLDEFYLKTLYAMRKKMGDTAYYQQVNLDEPQAVELDTATEVVKRLREGGSYRIPYFDMTDNRRYEGVSLKTPAPFVFVEGLFALVPKPLRKLMDMKIFVQADEAVRVQRFWKRAAERNEQPGPADILLKNVLKMHNKHVEPTKAKADIIIDGNANPEALRAILTRLGGMMLKTFYPPFAILPPKDEA